MHPLKDQREGVKYGRGVKYGITPGVNWSTTTSTGCKNQIKVVLTLRGALLRDGECIMSQIYLQVTKVFTICYTYILNIK